MDIRELFKKALETGEVPRRKEIEITLRENIVDYMNLNVQMLKTKSINRWDFIREFTFAIPCQEAIEAIKDLDVSIVEIGAGTGLWSFFLNKNGVEIEAYDNCQKEVSQFGQQVGKYFPVNILLKNTCLPLEGKSPFICWPDYNTDFAYQVACRVELGQYLIYIGESPGGCTANDDFFDLVWNKKLFTEVSCISIPQWYGIHDEMYIWKCMSKL